MTIEEYIERFGVTLCPADSRLADWPYVWESDLPGWLEGAVDRRPGWRRMYFSQGGYQAAVVRSAG